jgi:hypothetical protein
LLIANRSKSSKQNRICGDKNFKKPADNDMLSQ